MIYKEKVKKYHDLRIFKVNGHRLNNFMMAVEELQLMEPVLEEIVVD